MSKFTVFSTGAMKDIVRNAEVLFNKSKASIAPVIRNSGLVRVMDIPDMSGREREFSEVDGQLYAPKKREHEAAKKRENVQGFTKIGYLNRFGDETDITFEARKWGKYPEIMNGIKSLGKTIVNRLELDGQHRIGFGHETSYVDYDGDTVDVTVGDGLSLFNTLHRLKGTTKTYRNTLNGNAPLSISSLEAMEKMRKENAVNQFGEKITQGDDILWTTDDPATTNEARNILRSTARPEVDFSAGVYNSYQGKYKHVELPLIATDAKGTHDTTKAKYWGVANSDMTTLYLGINEEPHMKKPEKEEDFHTDTITLGARGAWMYVTVGANWIAASKGDNS